MTLKVYNTQSKKLEDFVPFHPPRVNMYVCGPTVYGYLHVGNFRGVVFFNFLRNWLEHLGYEVSYALNFTDVDDKIIQRAQEEGVSPSELSERYIAEYKKDFAALGLRSHDHNPKVTEHMKDIIGMVQELVDKKKAYETQGDVMYSISSFPDYGKLSGHNPEDLVAGSRVEVDGKKQNPLDFALWKAAKPGEVSWPSPWGPGRPGWHIECSAMIRSLYGPSIDIHGGGSDLVFPHHENEIAQSEGCSGHEFVKYWMHTNMLNFGGQKMSKSLGNIVTMREFLKLYNAEIYKWMILSVHYRTLSDFGEAAVDRAVHSLARIYSALALAETYVTAEAKATDPAFDKLTDSAWQKLTEALNHDMGTPEAFAAVFELVRSFNSQVRRGMKAQSAVQGKALSFLRFFQKLGPMMSLFQEPAQDYLVRLDDMLLKKMNLSRETVEALVEERRGARATKDFAKSDELRGKLTEMGISVSDTPEGSFWEVTK